MENQIALRPSYWASVSGGKDSLYMLNLILHNPDKYPLDGVVHFELETDYPFIHKVIDYMEAECKRFGIRFVRIKPRKTWEELYNKYLFPTRKVRWCLSDYKLDAKKQIESFLEAQGYYCVHYIGYCLDEQKRWSKRQDRVTEIYPLVQEGVNEFDIWQWARNEPIFNNYYKTNKRCGCMLCPMATKMEMAYTLKYYPQWFEYMIEKIRETEQIVTLKTGNPYAIISSNPKYNAEYLDNIIRTKWLPRLNELEKENEQ